MDLGRTLTAPNGARSAFECAARRLAVLLSALGVMLATAVTPAGASSPADQGITAKAISFGIPYVNFAALRSLGVTINDGSFPDAFNAVIAGINATRGDRRPDRSSRTLSR